jgi:nucleotidyltransferase/DNA polymerase involved in DNA repair
MPAPSTSTHGSPPASRTGHEVAYLAVPHFGVAVARRADRSLGQGPLVLLDDQDHVLDADARAARTGIRAGMSAHQAVARCPGAIVRPGSRYPVWEAQDRLWDLVKGMAGRWQPAGLGCAYLDLAGLGELLSWCQILAGAVRKLGWEPALGATGSKYGAWVAGEAAGRNAALLLEPGSQRSFLAGQPITMLPLEADAVAHLRHLGVRTLGQFTRLPASGITTRFGPAGRTAHRWAQGLDDRPVIPPWEAPEVSARVEFETPLADRELLLAALWRRGERLLAPLQERFQAVSRIALLATRADGRIVPGSHTFPQPAAAAAAVRLGLATALDRVAWDEQPAAEITLTLAGITDAPGRQLTLFDLDYDNSSRLQHTLDRLATRFGPEAFRFAVLASPENPLPERRVSWIGAM